MKMNFDYFQIQKWMLYTVGKSRWKNGVICLVSMFPSWVMVRKLPKKVHFSQFCADLSIKSKSVKAICIYAHECSHYTLSESGMVNRGPNHRSWDISNWNIKKDADSAET